MLYPCDWAILTTGDDTILGLLEVKCRKKKYDTYMVSLRKVATMIHYAAVAQCEPILLVKWEDTKEIGFVNLMTATKTASWGGRRDRDDWQDEEPVIHIPVEEFQIIAV